MKQTAWLTDGSLKIKIAVSFRSLLLFVWMKVQLWLKKKKINLHNKQK